MHRTKSLIGAAALVVAGLTTAASAQTFQVIAQEGQPVGGIANVQFVNNLKVNNSGSLFYELDLDNATTEDLVVLLDGNVLYQQGTTPLAGFTFDFIDDMHITNGGDLVYNASLDGTPGGSSDDTGVFFNMDRVIAEGSAPTAPGAPAGSFYSGFFGVKGNDSGNLLVRASINDAGTTLSSLVTANSDGSNQQILAIEGGTLPGLGGAIINDIETDSDEFDFNNAGDAIFGLDVGPNTTDDTVIYHSTLGVLAREGSASPLSGVNYSSLASSEVAINNSGDVVFTADLDTGDTANDYAIIKNGDILLREGDAAPNVAGRFVQTLSSTPLALDDAGNLLFVADLDGDTVDDRVLYYNDSVLLREGVSMIDGLLVETIETLDDSLSISDNGQYVFVDVQLEGGLQTAVLITIPEPTSFGLLGAAAAGLLLRRRRA